MWTELWQKSYKSKSVTLSCITKEGIEWPDSKEVLRLLSRSRTQSRGPKGVSVGQGSHWYLLLPLSSFHFLSLQAMSTCHWLSGSWFTHIFGKWPYLALGRCLRLEGATTKIVKIFDCESTCCLTAPPQSWLKDGSKTGTSLPSQERINTFYSLV